MARLQRTIENDLVPRLMVSHRAGPVPPSLAVAAARQLSDEDLQQFLKVVRGPDDANAATFVQDLVTEGVSIESVYLDLLAPAARQLGTLWQSDECDFVEVTVALGRMQRSLRDLSHVFLADSARPETVGNVLLSCVPGEQHTLGIIMVGEFMLRDGWRVLVGAPYSGNDLHGEVSTEWYDVIGFSVGCESRLSALKREVRRLRAASRNPDVKIIVGGKVFADDPDMIARVGADAYASDARGAPQVARALLNESRSRAAVVASRETNSGHGELSETIRHE
ncbi:MAG TPA: cobalamin-dependent protein [Gemmatimonas sp.]|nr:cobalamin-dependent protein [Gemmatimonas sp.]